MLNRLTLLGCLGSRFGLLLALLRAGGGAGVVGLRTLYSTAHHAVVNNVDLSARASVQASALEQGFDGFAILLPRAKKLVIRSRA